MPVGQQFTAGNLTRAGRSASKKTQSHTVGQRPQFLVSCWQEASISHHMGLSIELFTTWQLTTLNEQGKEGWGGSSTEGQRRGKSHNVFYNLSLAMIHYFHHILLATQYVRGLYNGINTRRQGSLGPSWKLATQRKNLAMSTRQKAKVLLTHLNSLCYFFNPLTIDCILQLQERWADCRSYSIARLGEKITKS